MPAELPYLPSYKNVDQLFTRIASAKRPDTFSTRFLADMIGLKSTADRALITLLKTFGFIDAAGKPTPHYDQLKNPERAPYAIGDAIRRAYAPLFAANENANTLPADQLKGLISQVAGTDEVMTKRIAWTLGSLFKIAKFGDAAVQPQPAVEKEHDEEEKETLPPPAKGSFRPDFHYNIQIHLPSNGTEETYINIFNAVRRVFR
jgi:hypothetical protein